MNIALSQLKEYEQAKIKAVMDICPDQCFLEGCPHQHRQKVEKKPSKIRAKILAFFGKKNCQTKKQLTETFPFIGEDTIRERIFALGIIPGATVRMMGKSPLRDPMVVDLSGHLVSLRKAEADLVMVEIQE